MLLYYVVRGAETANIPRTAPIAKVLTLNWVVGLVRVRQEEFPRRTPWSKVRHVELFRASAIWRELVKSRILLVKIV